MTIEVFEKLVNATVEMIMALKVHPRKMENDITDRVCRGERKFPLQWEAQPIHLKNDMWETPRQKKFMGTLMIVYNAHNFG